MPRNSSTLRELCLQRIAGLLKSSYWNPELPLSHNPFALLPSKLIDTLITYVSRISTSEPLLSSDLRLLLAPGRVREFILDTEEDACHETKVDDFHLQKILMDLLPSCRHLITLKICPVKYPIQNSCWVTPALNWLLSEALHLEHVESCIEFDLRVLCNAHQLEKLVLHFLLQNPIHGFLEVDHQFKRNDSLKHLEIADYESVSHIDIAIILKYCTELIFINYDIAKSLEYLHANELHKGCLTHRYKIQKCFLKYSHSFGMNSAASPTYDGVHIAALTCPHLQELRIIVNDDDVISSLSDFRNLRNLNIECKLSEFGDFTANLQSLLEKPEIGQNLKYLKLRNFSSVDFSSIGMCCPNVEALKVTYISEISRGEYSPTSFRKLQVLFLTNRILSNDDCKSSTLLGILSNAINLKRLKITRASNFTDDVLEAILKKNSLSELKNVNLIRSGFSLHGWRNLARSLTALEYLYVYEPNLSFRELANVIREINPRITVKWKVDY